jgi:hypothetical protein
VFSQLPSPVPNRNTARDVVNPSRHIELDIDIGADAKDWSAIAAGEKLKPTEIELRRIEEQVAEIVAEMDYLRTREQKLRDTNESTNTRVKWFATGTMFLLIALGVWQVIYLRTYFRYAPILPLTRRTVTDSRLDPSILSRRDTFSLLYFYETLLCVRGFRWRRWSIAGMVGKSCAFERVRCLQCVMGMSRIVDT